MVSAAVTSSILSNANTQFLAQLFARYKQNPNNVDGEWAHFFAQLDDDAKAILNDSEGASWGNGRVTPDYEMDVPWAAPAAAPRTTAKANDTTAFNAADIRAFTIDSIRALMLIRAYRVRGHVQADLDPLKLSPPTYHPELDYKSYGFTESDLDRDIFIDNVLGLQTASLRDIIAVCQQTYCGRVGFEFMHIQDADAKGWLQERIEGTQYHNLFSVDEKKQILRELNRGEAFEKYLQLKYTGTKRFGVEGGESIIPALDELIRQAANHDVAEIIFGMAHRGRLNVLANVLDKSLVAIFSEFQGTPAHPEDVQGSGDVKYHLGTSVDKQIGDKTVHLSLTANPSHLEAVDPVVIGKVRAKQDRLGDKERSRVMGVLLHGDAAFAGQGIVAETFGFSDLKGYRTGGTVHFVINNQIGFTTNPSFSRSSPYCSDVALMVKSPIFHVNGDDPEAVVWVTRLAVEYRQRFKKDVVVDIYCYRRQGHNESDEPAFTQPKMYQAIAKHPTTRTLYAKALIERGFISEEEDKAISADYQKVLEQAFDAATNYRANKADWLEGAWAGLGVATGDDRKGHTAVSLDLLKQIGERITTVPDSFNLNPKIKRQLVAKANAIKTGEGIDWATAEALAFGSLLAEGSRVRLSGQDCGRGTFSQRHAILYDQTDETPYIPLNNLWAEQATIEVIDSPLAENSVLGFDYGYSTSDPNTLVLWEAQFGDFVNGAQVIIDQFISSAESKWLRMSGLVMLLPHGYEGQGPEHSSARLERFLQQCAEDNLQVANCSTPANYFHILRRQLRRNFRKPLILMTPKSLLRHKLCVSRLEDMGLNSTFHRVLPEIDTLVADSKIKRVVLCSGKVYYDLYEARAAANIKDIALVRLEQFYPFPVTSLEVQLQRYKGAQVIWCQEEPENMGAWTFVDRRLEAVMQKVGMKAGRPQYAGRPEAASPAAGSLKRHNAEQEALLRAALSLK